MDEEELDYENGECSDEEEDSVERDYSEFVQEDETGNEKGFFHEDVERAIDHNRFILRFSEDEVAAGRMTPSERYHFLTHEMIDISRVRDMAEGHQKELEAEFDEIYRLLDEGEIDSLSAELKMEQVLSKQAKIKHNLGLLSVGLTYEDLGDLSDDWRHVVDDAHDPESRELRKDIRKKMQGLSPQERKKLLDDLVESGKIDEHEYNELFIDFM
jgi:hypothetical protein